MKNKYPFPLCGSFLCTWILFSTYLICLSSFLGLILVFSANFCLKAFLQSPHHTYNNLLDCLWLNQPCMALKPGHTPPFEPLQAEELLCTLVSPETIWHIFLFIWQWSQLVFHSDPSPSLQNSFLTISSSSCSVHCSFNNFHLSFFRKASYYTKMMLFVRILLNSKHCTAYWQPHSAWNCLPINNILLISLSRLFMNLLARPRADPWGLYQNICCHFFTLNYW